MRIRNRQNIKSSLKRGFTLVEMVISVAIVGILFTGVAALMPVVSQAYVQDIEKSYSKLIAENIVQAVRDDILYAQKITNVNEGKNLTYVNATGEHTIDSTLSATEMIEIDGLVYDEKYYNGKTADVVFSFDNATKICTITVTISRAGKEMYKTTRNIHVIGIP